MCLGLFCSEVSKKLLLTMLINTELGNLLCRAREFPYAAGWGSSIPGTCADLLNRRDYLRAEARQGEAMDISFYFLLQLVLCLGNRKIKKRESTSLLSPINKTEIGSTFTFLRYALPKICCRQCHFWLDSTGNNPARISTASKTVWRVTWHLPLGSHIHFYVPFNKSSSHSSHKNWWATGRYY